MSIENAVSEPIWLDPLVNFLAVLVGASLAWLTSYWFEKQKTKKEELATAYSLLFKVHSLTDDLFQLERIIENKRDKLPEEITSHPMWTWLDDVLGFKDTNASLEARELALLARTKDDELLRRTMELESGHRITLEVVGMISQLRQELKKFGQSVNGNVVSIAITEKEMPQAAPTLIRLGTASKDLEEMLPGVLENARAVAQSIGGHLKEHYKFDHFKSISAKEPQPAEG